MTSSWKRRAFNLIFPAALIVAALFPNQPVAAAGCPTAPVDEQGGKHWCYNHDSTKGHVHLWTPPGFKADGAITAIYIHGHDLAGDPCPSAHYIDCAWDAHKLASQFKASGINALFVAVEGSTSGTDPKKWGSLSSLLASIADKGALTPPANVTVLGHSAGMYTANSLWNDARVKHVVALDWLKPPLDANVSGWYKGGQDRKLTIVSGSSGQTAIGIEVAEALGCPTVTGTSGLSADQIAARCLHIKGVAGGHMGVVTGQAAIPLALKRSVAGAGTGGAGTTPTSGGGAGTSVGSKPLSDAIIGGPTLEIPIPNVEFSDAIRQNGQITIPWLAQYVGGVYTFLLSIAGLLAAVMMVVGGFQYMTAGGDQSKIGAGKKRITDALTGLVLALASYTILYSINPELVAFDGLKVSGVATEVIEENDDPGNLQDFSTTPPAVDNVGFADGAKPFCTRKAGDCPEWCRKLSTNPAEWPNTTPGYMERSRTVRIPDHTYKGRLVLAGKGNYAHPKVVDALKATVEKMTDDYPDRKLRIEVGECHRTLESQISKVCVPGQGVIPGKDYGSAVANPGGSNHGVGYACDLHLYDGTDSLGIRYSTKTQCQSPIASLKLFDAIMFASGWVRYDREVWHYEYGTPKSVANRCGGDRGACSYPPAHYCGSK